MMKCPSHHQKSHLKNSENLVIHQINKNLPITQFNKPLLPKPKKRSEEQHLSEVKKMRDGYEEKIRNMKKNITETVAEEVAKVQKKY